VTIVDAMAIKKVLVTGATGEVGRLVVPRLSEMFDLRLLSRRDWPDEPRAVRGDLRDLDALLTAAHGVDAILHLAIATGQVGPYEDDAFNAERFAVNVTGTYHVFESARRLGVCRVINVSSLMVVWGYGADGLVPGDAPPHPVGTYALTKALGERIAQHYARPGTLDVLTMRIAAPLDPSDPRWRTQPVPPQRVPVVDLAQAFRLALTAELDDYAVVTIVGDSSRRCWDLVAARRVLGYEPSVRLDDLPLTLGDPFETPQ